MWGQRVANLFQLYPVTLNYPQIFIYQHEGKMIRIPILLPPKVEIWKEVQGFEGYYEVSNWGRVRSMERDIQTSRGIQHWKSRIMTPNVNQKSGYHYVHLSKDNKRFSFTIHRLVAIAFVDNPNMDNFDQVNHRDENLEHNWSTNLEWCDAEYNINYGHHKEKFIKSLKNFYNSPASEEQKRAAGKRGSKFFVQYNQEHSAELSERMKEMHRNNLCPTPQRDEKTGRFVSN